MSSVPPASQLHGIFFSCLELYSPSESTETSGEFCEPEKAFVSNPFRVSVRVTLVSGLKRCLAVAKCQGKHTQYVFCRLLAYLSPRESNINNTLPEIILHLKASRIDAFHL